MLKERFAGREGNMETEKKTRQHKIKMWNQITAVFATVVILLSVGWSFLRFQSIDIRTYENQVRLLTAEHNVKLEQGEYEPWKYAYLVCDLEGIVLYANSEFSKNAGDKVNVQEELSMDESFGKSVDGLVKKSFVLKKAGRVNGFVVYLIPEEDFTGENFNEKLFWCVMPACIGIVVGVLLLAGRLIYCNSRILSPIGEIAVSAQHIIRGNYEYEFRRVFNREVNADEVGELTYSFELMRDELKAKQIREEQLKKAQQEMISCISHDLKTPISTIKAYAEGMRDGIARDEAARAAYIQIVIEKTDLLINMIEELLKCSNAQLNQLEINRKEIYFLSFFEKAMKELEIYVRQQDMDFSFSVDMEDRLVSIDEKRILEVLYNLVENSMKYRKEHGKIQISASRKEDEVLIRVSDNGIGISSDDIPYVFDKFYRAEKSRTSSIPGSGLGLSICKYIVEQHNGTIYCKSQKEKGCEIGFTLPLDDTV